MNPLLNEYCRDQLEAIAGHGLLRALHVWRKEDARTVWLDGRQYLNFSSNDYLGLSVCPQIREGLDSLSQAGAGASRLITGNHEAYSELESAIADWKGTESALVFTTGYAAALGVIPALVGEKDFIVMDKLCHACLVDGARLSGATLRVFPHNHLQRCEELLKSCSAKAGSEGKVLLLTESVFSMDGDLAPLRELVTLKQRYGAWILVDEAHGSGVLGERGRGGSEHFGVENSIEISMGTLSKAIGSLGGFVCGSKSLRDLLINRARSLIYSTALPPSICRMGTQAIRLQRESHFRKRLWGNLRFLEKEFGWKTHSPILPVLIGDEERAVQISKKLRQEGIVVPAVRYPTVSRGKARLRISITAAHSEEDLLRLGGSLQSLGLSTR